MSEGLQSAGGSPPDGASVSFDQLDRLVRVTTIHGWVYLGTLFAVCGGRGYVLGTLSRSDQGPRRGNPADRPGHAGPGASPRHGRLVELTVKLDAEVKADQVIGEISQDELNDAIHEAEAQIERCRA